MINKVIEKEIKLIMVRDIFKNYMKDLTETVMKKYKASSCGYGINIAEDNKSLYVSLGVHNITFYTYLRNNEHRITAEYGVKIMSSSTYHTKTRKPLNLDEYLICNSLAVKCLNAIYEVLSLGELKRND